MARNNFQYEKRQRELDKKRKADEKAKRKSEAKDAPAEGESAQGADEPGQADGEAPDDSRSVAGVPVTAAPSGQA